MRIPPPGRIGRADLGERGQARPSAPRLCDRSRLRPHDPHLQVAQRRVDRARRGQRPDADDRGPRCERNGARLVCPPVELCRGLARGCAGDAAVFLSRKRLCAARRAGSPFGYRPDVRLAGPARLRARQRRTTGRAGRWLGRDERYFLRRRAGDAGDRRLHAARAWRADRHRLRRLLQPDARAADPPDPPSRLSRAGGPLCRDEPLFPARTARRRALCQPGRRRAQRCLRSVASRFRQRGARSRFRADLVAVLRSARRALLERLEAAQRRWRARTDRVGAALRAALACAFRRDELPATGRGRLRADCVRCGAAGPLPDRRAVVVGDAGQLRAMPVRRCCARCLWRRSACDRRYAREPRYRADRPAGRSRGTPRRVDRSSNAGGARCGFG